jgi:hypothetical protein
MKTPCLLLAALLLVAAPGRADSDSSPVRGPVLGYVLDSPAQAIRPLFGIPGASYFGAPLALPFPIASLAVSSRADFALAVSADGQPALYLLRSAGTAPAGAGPDDAAPEILPLPVVIAADARVILNADDSAAAVYSPGGRTLQVLRLGAGAPVPSAVLDLPGIVAAVVLSRDASWALVAADDGLYRLTLSEGNTPARLLGRFAEPSALALLPGERDAALVDHLTQDLFLIRNVAADPEILALAGARDGLSNPVGVAASADGRRLFVASAGDGTQSGSVAIVDVESRAVEIQPALDGAPARLVRLAGPSTFLLNEAGHGPVQIFDDAGQPGLFFVPAAAREQ